jgi:hypothetical protein
MAPGRRQLQQITLGKETQAQGTPATFFSRARVAGGMLNDNRSINVVDEMLGIIPGPTRSYVSSADGSISLGGTNLSPQQLPIHTANCISGLTYGTLSSAASTLAVVDGVKTLTCTTTSTTITISASTTRTVGDVIYSSAGVYVGTIKTTATGTSFELVNYANITLTANAYRFMTAAQALTTSFLYDFTLPTTTFPDNVVSYTIQAGDDFEQETTTYAKCNGFSASGGSGGAIDMSAQYMTQAIRLGVLVAGTITTSLASTAVTGVGTTFVASDVGRKLYTTDFVYIGKISAYSSATSVTLSANALVALTASEFTIGGFSVTTIPTPIEDLIFARSRLYINDVAAWPITTPTPVVYSFLNFSYQLQCQWTPKFTGEGYQGIDPTFSFALMTNYSVGGDFTIEHNETASGQYSASPVESLKYAWRNRVPKIVQIDCPGSTQLTWFTPNATTVGSAATGTISITSGTSAITGTSTTFASSDVGKDLFYSPSVGVYTWVGRIAAYSSATSVTLASNYLGTTITTQAFFMLTVTQPYFPVAGQGPIKTYTGVSFRMPVIITQVSSISDNGGNDIVSVQWTQRYNNEAGSAGDVRIVNQIATIPVAG